MEGGKRGDEGVGGVLLDRWLGKSPNSSAGAVSLNSELRMRHTGEEPVKECPLRFSSYCKLYPGPEHRTSSISGC